MADVKASEIVGELKKAARLYEVFQAAHKMVAVVSELEAKEAQAKASLEALEAEKAKVDKDIDEKVEKANAQVAAAKDEVKKLKDVADLTKEEAQKLLVKAKDEASSIVRNAENEAQKVRNGIAALLAEHRQLQQIVTDLKAVQAQAVEAFKTKREELLKVLN